MKLKDKSIEKIKEEMKEIKQKTIINNLWLHKNKRYIALLNEYERRII